MARLGIPNYRFSVSWSRVLPDGRTVNRAGVDFYRRLAEGLLERGITPLMTVYHWDLPAALDQGPEGGWLDRDVVDRFTDLALLLGRELGDLVSGATTLNEPWCSAFLGYAKGEHAPGGTDNALAYRAAHHLNLAHGRAATALRSVLPDTTEVSVTLNLHQVAPASDSDADRAAARHVDAVANRIFLDPMLRGTYPEDLIEGTRHITDWSFVRDGDLAEVHVPIDFLGINYYSPSRIEATPGGDGTWPGTDRARGVDIPGPKTVMGWPVVPEALTDLLLRVNRDYAVPMVVTENGCAGNDALGPDGRVHDDFRIDYLRAHIGALADAIGAGADVRGYYLWTLLDNFEWAWGYDKRFGIVHVDFDTQVRTPKDSAQMFRDVIVHNGLG